MVAISEPEYTADTALAELAAWYTMQQDLRKLRASEILMRQRIFGKLFPKPKEGTNTYDLPDDYKLKGIHQLYREVDEAQLAPHEKEFTKAKIDTEELIEWLPHLKVKGYRKLTDKQRKVFDQVLVIKDGMPSLSIKAPGEKVDDEDGE